MEIIPGTPKDVSGLRGGLINALMQNLSQGVPSYGGPMAGMDPLQMMASNLIAKQMGYGGYNGPNMFQAPRFPMQGLGDDIDWGRGHREWDTNVGGNGKITPRNLSPKYGRRSGGRLDAPDNFRPRRRGYDAI